jgi:hypothetical protein
MFKFLKLPFFALSLIIWNISSAEETQILDDATPAETTFESDFIGEPEVTIRKDGESILEEYRINGNLYMIKITLEGVTPYYLYRDSADGGWLRGDSISEPLIVPQWVVFEF